MKLPSLRGPSRIVRAHYACAAIFYIRVHTLPQKATLLRTMLFILEHSAYKICVTKTNSINIDTLNSGSFNKLYVEMIPQ